MNEIRTCALIEFMKEQHSSTCRARATRAGRSFLVCRFSFAILINRFYVYQIYIQ